MKDMIAVIADDFTGAAEIGGVGLRYGLKVLIETVVYQVDDIDLLVIATDTRSSEAGDAALQVGKIVEKLVELGVTLIFKKIDSVLRGHVALEIEAQMEATGKRKALIVASNPTGGRTIVKGQYFIDSVPLHETSFADDPDFPVCSSNVTEIVNSSRLQVSSVGLNDALDTDGLLIADASTPEDLNSWAKRIAEDMVVAGGAGFFDIFLGTMYSRKETAPTSDLIFGDSSLFVFGSKFPKNEGLEERFYSNKVVKSNMPEAVFFNMPECKRLLKSWASSIVEDLSTGRSVMITIDHQPSNEVGLSLHLKECIGLVVAAVADKFELRSLFIEGGATAFVVLQYLNINSLVPVNEIDQGVIQMKAQNYPRLIITTKPGSYAWPENFSFEKNMENRS